MEAYGNGTYYAHVEYTFREVPTNYRIPVMIVAAISMEGNYSTEKSSYDRTWWGSVYYDVFFDEAGYSVLLGRSREDYFSYINSNDKGVNNKELRAGSSKR